MRVNISLPPADIAYVNELTKKLTPKKRKFSATLSQIIKFHKEKHGSA